MQNKQLPTIIASKKEPRCDYDENWLPSEVVSYDEESTGSPTDEMDPEPDSIKGGEDAAIG